MDKILDTDRPRPVPIVDILQNRACLAQLRSELGHAAIDPAGETAGYAKIAAPMVRFSKLPFRQLCKRWGTDVAYTPMILANVFRNAQIARDCEFTTAAGDQPVVIQFAANNAVELADAAELAAPFVNGIDLNCGCPQRWAVRECIGSHLLSDPETVRDMIRAVKSRVSPLFPTGIPFSIKIRLLERLPGESADAALRRTVSFSQHMQAAGVDFVAVHGRTRRQKSTEPCNVDAVRVICDSLDIPTVANGNVFSLDDADALAAATGVAGVMAARGLLANPALFDERRFVCTPPACVRDFVGLALDASLHTTLFQRHLAYMMPMGRSERKILDEQTTKAGMVEFLREYFYGYGAGV